MANLKYYKQNHKDFKEAYAEKLTDPEARYFFKRLRSRWKLRHRLHLFGTGDGGSCNKWRVRVSHLPTLGLLAHELAHALQFKRQGLGIRTERWHTKKHTRLMHRVLKVINNGKAEWKKQVALNLEKCKKNEVLREERMQLKAAHATSPEGKLNKLKEQEKSWLTKQKRANNALKKIHRRIKIWAKKAGQQEEIEHLCTCKKVD